MSRSVRFRAFLKLLAEHSNVVVKPKVIFPTTSLIHLQSEDVSTSDDSLALTMRLWGCLKLGDWNSNLKMWLAALHNQNIVFSSAVPVCTHLWSHLSRRTAFCHSPLMTPHRRRTTSCWHHLKSVKLRSMITSTSNDRFARPSPCSTLSKSFCRHGRRRTMKTLC